MARTVGPTFIGVGAARSGTTSLYHWLKQHPQVFMSPIKETNYFACSELRTVRGPKDADVLKRPLRRFSNGKFEERPVAVVDDWDTYLELFAHAGDTIARGEISPSYLFYPDVAQRISQKLPQIKIVILLRDPIERAFSNYKMLVLSGREHLSFRQAMDIEERRLARQWEHFWALKGLGLYTQQISRYFDVFPKERIGVWLYEDLRFNSKRVFQEIIQFLELDDHVQVEFMAKNTTSPRTGLLRRLLIQRPYIRALLRTVFPTAVRRTLGQIDRTILGRSLYMTRGERAYLLEYYRDDILALNQILPELNVTRWITTQEEKLKHDYE